MIVFFVKLDYCNSLYYDLQNSQYKKIAQQVSKFTYFGLHMKLLFSHYSCILPVDLEVTLLLRPLLRIVMMMIQVLQDLHNCCSPH